MSTPISDRKLAANRENAKKSTGPRTARGKAVSSLNAMTCGIFAKHAVATAPLLMENPAEYLSLLESLRTHFAPVGTLEDTLVQQIANTIWNSGRLARVEAAGVTARVYAALSESARKNEERSWTQMHLQNSLPLSSYTGRVTAQMFEKQADLVARLDDDDTRYEDLDEFLTFVWKAKLSGADQQRAGSHRPESDSWPDDARAYLGGLSVEEREKLEDAFQTDMIAVLATMREERVHESAREVAIERALIPSEGELDRLIRYESHLSRSVERKIDMLLNLQAARNAREGGAS